MLVCVWYGGSGNQQMNQSVAHRMPNLPNPGNDQNYNSRIGESFTFSVTGRASGPIWGTNVYTTDSDLASAAVHAGILKNDETGSIKVTIKESPEQFVGSAANGVTSGAWQKFPAAFVIE